MQLKNLAGDPSGSYGFVDGFGSDARFDMPVGLALSVDRLHLYVADYNNYAIRDIDLNSGYVGTLVSDLPFKPERVCANRDGQTLWVLGHAHKTSGAGVSSGYALRMTTLGELDDQCGTGVAVDLNQWAGTHTGYPPPLSEIVQDPREDNVWWVKAGATWYGVTPWCRLEWKWSWTLGRTAWVIYQQPYDPDVCTWTRNDWYATPGLTAKMSANWKAVTYNDNGTYSREAGMVFVPGTTDDNLWAGRSRPGITEGVSVGSMFGVWIPKNQTPDPTLGTYYITPAGLNINYAPTVLKIGPWPEVGSEYTIEKKPPPQTSGTSMSGSTTTTVIEARTTTYCLLFSKVKCQYWTGSGWSSYILHVDIRYPDGTPYNSFDISPGHRCPWAANEYPWASGDPDPPGYQTLYSITNNGPDPIILDVTVTLKQRVLGAGVSWEIQTCTSQELEELEIQERVEEAAHDIYEMTPADGKAQLIGLHPKHATGLLTGLQVDGTTLTVWDWMHAFTELNGLGESILMKNKSFYGMEIDLPTETFFFSCSAWIFDPNGQFDPRKWDPASTSGAFNNTGYNQILISTPPGRWQSRFISDVT